MPTELQPVRLFAALAGGRVDAASGIIYGVSVITEGPALGHNAFDEKRQQFLPMYCDGTTLTQMKSCAEQYAGGLKVKINHYSGAESIVGALRTFRIDGPKLRADLHLLKSAEARDYVLELAQDMPESCGLSVSFSGQPELTQDKAMARCTEIYSADLVDEPAANPDGLFGRGRFDDPKISKGLTPATSPNMEKELLQKLGELIDAKLAPVTAGFEKQLSELKTAHATALGKIEESHKLATEAADKAALSAVKEFAKTLGQPAGAAAAPSAPAQPPAPAKKFEEIVRGHAKYATSKATAIAEAMQSNPSEYKEYLSRVQKGGDVILF